MLLKNLLFVDNSTYIWIYKYRYIYYQRNIYIYINVYIELSKKLYIYIYIYNLHLMYIYIYIYICWPTVVECDPKAPFSITSTPRYRERRYSFPWTTPITLAPYLMILSSHQISFFQSLVWLDRGLNPSLPEDWQTLYSLCYYIWNHQQ